jgi:hypothetical protein
MLSDCRLLTNLILCTFVCFIGYIQVTNGIRFSVPTNAKIIHSRRKGGDR